MNRREYLKSVGVVAGVPFTSLGQQSPEQEIESKYPLTIQGLERDEILDDFSFELVRSARYGDGRIAIDEYEMEPNEWANSEYSVKVDSLVYYPDTLFEGIRLATSHIARVDAEVHYSDNYIHRYFAGRHRDWEVFSQNREDPYVAVYNGELHEFDFPWERNRFITETVRSHIQHR